MLRREKGGGIDVKRNELGKRKREVKTLGILVEGADEVVKV